MAGKLHGDAVAGKIVDQGVVDPIRRVIVVLYAGDLATPASLNMRMPQKLLEAVKVKAERKGILYSHYVRMPIEQDVSG